MKKVLVILLCLYFAGATVSKAQDIGQIISGSTADANKYLNAYLQPFGKGEILNMGRGWYNTARVHKTLGIDVTVSAQLAIIPQGSQNFVFKNSDYSTFQLKNAPGAAGSAIVPTFIGGNTTQAIQVSTTVNGHNVSYAFNTPTGVGGDLNKFTSVIAVPLPVAQVGLGLFAHTEVKARYFPQTNFGGTQIGVFGVALQNEFGKFIPFFKRIPLIHLSALVGYNSVTTSYDLTGKSNVPGANQKAEVDIKASTAALIASVKLALFEIYTSVSYTSGKTDASLKGTYTFTYNNPITNLPAYTNTVTDPIALSYTNSGVSNTWGLRINLLILKVFADYTFNSTYNGVGAGVSFSIR